ncbi:hypothetical protein PG985_013677 [Apiospora marii]|uniref:uncharacterized protein n=1 Tax=Apiospora marii TaxID=335849 RepID=UPI003132252B
MVSPITGAMNKSHLACQLQQRAWLSRVPICTGLSRFLGDDFVQPPLPLQVVVSRLLICPFRLHLLLQLLLCFSHRDVKILAEIPVCCHGTCGSETAVRLTANRPPDPDLNESRSGDEARQTEDVLEEAAILLADNPVLLKEVVEILGGDFGEINSLAAVGAGLLDVLRVDMLVVDFAALVAQEAPIAGFRVGDGAAASIHGL